MCAAQYSFTQGMFKIAHIQIDLSQLDSFTNGLLQDRPTKLLKILMGMDMSHIYLINRRPRHKTSVKTFLFSFGTFFPSIALDPLYVLFDIFYLLRVRDPLCGDQAFRCQPSCGQSLSHQITLNKAISLPLQTQYNPNYSMSKCELLISKSYFQILI